MWGDDYGNCQRFIFNIPPMPLSSTSAAALWAALMKHDVPNLAFRVLQLCASENVQGSALQVYCTGGKGMCIHASMRSDSAFAEGSANCSNLRSHLRDPSVTTEVTKPFREFRQRLRDTIEPNGFYFDLFSTDDASGNAKFDAHFRQTGGTMVDRFRCRNHQNNIIMTTVYHCVDIGLLHRLFVASKFLNQGTAFWRCCVAVRKFVDKTLRDRSLV